MVVTITSSALVASIIVASRSSTVVFVPMNSRARLRAIRLRSAGAYG
jgi:hypothetical protein